MDRGCRHPAFAAHAAACRISALPSQSIGQPCHRRMRPATKLALDLVLRPANRTSSHGKSQEGCISGTIRSNKQEIRRQAGCDPARDRRQTGRCRAASGGMTQPDPATAGREIRVGQAGAQPLRRLRHVHQAEGVGAGAVGADTEGNAQGRQRAHRARPRCPSRHSPPGCRRWRCLYRAAGPTRPASASWRAPAAHAAPARPNRPAPEWAGGRAPPGTARWPPHARSHASGTPRPPPRRARRSGATSHPSPLPGSRWRARDGSVRRPARPRGGAPPPSRSRPPRPGVRRLRHCRWRRARSAARPRWQALGHGGQPGGGADPGIHHGGEPAAQRLQRSEFGG